MIQIRRNVFETNSSSTHSITMCMKSDYIEFSRGTKYLVGRYNAPKKFMTFEELIKWMIDTKDIDCDAIEELQKMHNDGDLEGVEDYLSDYNIYTESTYENTDLENFYKEFTTPGCETVVAFGHYGYDG